MVTGALHRKKACQLIAVISSLWQWDLSVNAYVAANKGGCAGAHEPNHGQFAQEDVRERGLVTRVLESESKPGSTKKIYRPALYASQTDSSVKLFQLLIVAIQGLSLFDSFRGLA